ncbi:MAG: adenylyltransferase/cytidyltransferase family protein, partial [Coriobacteriales bacterium]|nr:adenylyltransferase/cytidyltransferase family protein [Coriobacteriales bacterium]
MSEIIAIQHVVVPGTFDPITYGHLDVIARARRLFPKVTVAVAASVGKNGTGPVFSLDQRVQMIRDTLAESQVAAGIDVMPFTGLLMNFCREVGAGGVVKGLRAMTDFEYE